MSPSEPIRGKGDGILNSEAELELLRAVMDATLDGQALLEPLIESGGVITDLVYREVNPAICDILGVPREELIGRRITQTFPHPYDSELLAGYLHCAETGAPLTIDDYKFVNNILPGQPRRFDVRGTRVRGGWLSVTLRDVTAQAETARRIAESEERYRLLADNSTEVVSHTRNDTTILWVSPSVEQALGAPPQYWVGRTAIDLVHPDDLPIAVEVLGQASGGKTMFRRLRVLDKDRNPRWAEFHLGNFFDADGNSDGYFATFRIIDAEVAAERAVGEARRQQAMSDARYRRLMDNSIVPTSLNAPDGHFVLVNEAMADFFGYGTQTLLGMTWQELTPADGLEKDRELVANLLAGSQDSYRVTKRYLHADGHQLWGDVMVSCIRNTDGTVEHLIVQIVDITAAVQSRQELVEREELNGVLAQALQSDLDSAARYVESVLPGDLDGPVPVSSRYLPSRTLGGDCFDYGWIDDDHLLVKMLDVSGHGVDSALIAVSIHNLLRAGPIPAATVLNPSEVLPILNHQFKMEHHNGNYFTLFYGVYQPSTRTLRYASAGHPPALLFTEGKGFTTLAAQSPPVGTFDETTFSTTTVTVPPGSHLLIYSDGAFELRRSDGELWTFKQFIDLCTELASTPEWSLDDLLDSLGRLSAEGFTDDCSLIKLDIP